MLIGVCYWFVAFLTFAILVRVLELQELDEFLSGAPRLSELGPDDRFLMLIACSLLWWLFWPAVGAYKLSRIRR